MSKKAKKDRKAVAVPPPASKRSAVGRTAILMTIVIPVLAGFWWLKPSHLETQPPGPPPGQAGPVTASEAAAPADFQKLKGRWLRPDGGYVVQVKGVDGGGRMDASYFNPRSIHVAKAEASLAGAVTKVFIELRDVNYPGSTYDLTYDPQTDRLVGIYYQAALQQSFEVLFIHME